MAPHKKKQAVKKRDTSPEPSSQQVLAQDLGIRVSPARTPKKLLRNKKRKQLIESLSPSPKSSKHVLGTTPSTSKAGSSNKSSSSNTPSILSYFTKAKPVQYVDCPVCAAKVPMSKINQHLDSNCLNSGDKSGGNVVLVESCAEDEGKKLATFKRGGKTNKQSSPGRKKVGLKNDIKDQRTILRLKKKMESHALYQVLDSSGSVVEESGSDLSKQSDADVEDVQSQERVHRSLFSDNNNMPNCSWLTPLSTSTRHMPCKKKTFTKSSYRQQKEEPSDDCIIVSSKQSENSGLSPSKKLLKQFRPLTKMALSTVQSSTPSIPLNDISGPNTSKERTLQLNSSPTKFEQNNHLNTCPVNNIGELSQKSAPKKLDHTPLQDHSFSEQKYSDMAVVNSPSNSNQPNSSIKYTQVSPVRSASVKSPLLECQQSSTIPHNSPNRNLGSPNSRLQATHQTPVSSPMRSQAVSPACSSSTSTYSPSRRDPYYLANFKLILLTVLSNEDDKSLFSEEDLAFVNTFKTLSGPAQQLYVRLFQRKHAWIRAAKLDYPRIAVDLKPVISELETTLFLQGEKDLNNIEEALNLLPAPDIKTLAKSLRVSSASTQKSDIVSALLKHGRQQRSIFNVNMKQVVMKKAGELLGSCVRLHSEPRTVFSRILLLFSLAVNMEDEDQASGGQTQMQTLLMVNMGRVSYPDYTVFRARKIFRTRDDLIRYEEANQYDQDIAAAMGTHDFELALRILHAAKDRFTTIQQDESITSHDQALPPFLRHFTASWMYTRLHFTGVEIYQKMRCYGDAVTSLRLLLDQTVYCMDSRGCWWDRLALNLDQHSKKPNEALDAILEGLTDPFVKVGHRLALQQRAQKIFKSPRNKKLLDRQEEFTFDDIRELPKVTIQGQVLPFQAPGVKNTFVRRLQGGSPSSGSGDTDVAICSVEQVALQHYKNSGYEEGVHGEASVFTTLIFLLFWDIVFMSGIPDVFSYPYQSAPLDIRYSSFYESRKEAVDEKLQELSQTDINTLQILLESSWKNHEGETSVGVSWELFRDIDHAKGLLACLGGKILCAIAARILKNHRHTRAGMPDLTVWNTKSKKYKVVEVKGPGDRLSHKQILWMDFLLGCGVDTEVCYVQASSKRLRIN